MADFKYVESLVNSEDMLGFIKEEVTGFVQYPHNTVAGDTPVTNKWAVEKETLTAGKVSELILRGECTIGEALPRTKVVYLRLLNPVFTDTTKHSQLTVQTLDGKVGQTFTEEGPPVLFEWARHILGADRNRLSSVYVYLSLTNNRLCLANTGDPAVSFTDYRKSFMYAGVLTPFKFNEDDVTGNFVVTAGAVTAEPTNAQLITRNEYFGENTSPGNNSLQMFQTKSFVRFQKHYPAFITQAPPHGMAFVDNQLGNTGLVMDAQGFQASRWTGKYHMSPIYVVHSFEGYRGVLEKVVAVAKHNILHLDDLIVDVEGKNHKQEVYRFFDTNTEQNFMNFSANVRMGVAVLKEYRY